MFTVKCTTKTQWWKPFIFERSKKKKNHVAVDDDVAFVEYDVYKIQ
jgi:oligoribonuclease (3'-5' exoribonuclease)